jgi:hypothetical protein
MYNFNFQSRQQSHIKAQQQIKQNKLIAKSIISIRNKKIQRAKMVRYNYEVWSYNKARALQAVIEKPCVVEETQLVLKEEAPCVVEELRTEEKPCVVEEIQLVLKEEEPCVVEETQLVLKEEEPCVVEEIQLVLKEEEPCVVEELCAEEEPCVVKETSIIEELKPVVSVHKDLVYFFKAMKFE